MNRGKDPETNKILLMYDPYRFQTVLYLLSRAIGGMGEVGWLEQIISHGGAKIDVHSVRSDLAHDR